MADDHTPKWEARPVGTYDRLERECDEAREALRAAEQALVDLHESLFIGSERGLSNETLRSMAAFAKKAALAAAAVPVAAEGEAGK